MHALSNYNNSSILIVTPESDLSADQQALNANFKSLATVVTTYVPYTGATDDVNLGTNGLSAGAGQFTSVVVTTANGAISIGPNAGSAAAGSITAHYDGTRPPVMMLNAGHADSNLTVQPPFHFVGDGVALSSVNDDNTANASLEIRATGFFLNSLSSGSILFGGSDSPTGAIYTGGPTEDAYPFEIGSDGSLLAAAGEFTVDGSGNASCGSIALTNTATPSSPVPGQIYFDGTHFWGYNGTTWLRLDN